MTWNNLELEDEDPEAGCMWPVVDLCADPDDDTEVTEASQWAEQMAIEILWAASGRQFGVCHSKYRPCSRGGCVPGEALDVWNLTGRGTRFTFDPIDLTFAVIGCGCTASCTCTSIESFPLWHQRVRKIVEVVIDGNILPASSYRLSKGRLIRTDGELWPTCQDWNVPAGEPGAWTVEYLHGRPVPMGGRISAGVLRKEIMLACAGSDDCELPKRTQTVTRAGVTIGFLDPMEFLDKGRTGLELPDQWLSKVNPNSLQRGARVYRHDDPRRRRRARA